MNDNAYGSMPMYLHSEYCGRDSFLRTSALLTRCQTLAGIHFDSLGYNSPEMLEKGLLWVVLRINAEVKELPKYGDSCRLITWCGKPRFSLFPRFFELQAEDGRPLIGISSTWSIMNAEKRCFASQEEFGMQAIPVTENGREIPQKVKFPKDVFTEDSEYNNLEVNIPYSWLDLNGHMNNTRYLDLADDILPSPMDSRTLKSMNIEYCNEIKGGSTISVSWKETEPFSYYMEGSTDKVCYKLQLKY